MSPRHVERISTPPRVAVAPTAVLALLRAVVGSRLLAPLPDEHAATMGRPLPEAMAIDAGAWVAWCIVGLHVCERLRFGEEPDGPVRSWLDVMAETAKRLVIVLAVRRASGHLPRAAEALRMQRRTLRGWLLPMGLHPWPTELTAQQRPPEPAANGPGALAIANALAWILERAEALRADAHDPHRAIDRAVKESGAGRTLACIAFAAWGLAVGGDASDVRGSAAKGGE